MTLHELRRRSPAEAAQAVDAGARQEFLEEGLDLGAALGVSPEWTADLRRQGIALLEVGRWAEAIDVFTGLLALGELHPADARGLALAHRALGHLEQAELLQTQAAALEAALEGEP